MHQDGSQAWHELIHGTASDVWLFAACAMVFQSLRFFRFRPQHESTTLPARNMRTMPAQLAFCWNGRDPGPLLSLSSGIEYSGAEKGNHRCPADSIALGACISGSTIPGVSPGIKRRTSGLCKAPYGAVRVISIRSLPFPVFLRLSFIAPTSAVVRGWVPPQGILAKPSTSQ